MVGIDMGLEHFAILSNGEKIDNPRYLRKHLRKLGLAQRKLARKKKGSSNYRKARLKAAKAYAKVKDSRIDFLHKLSTRIIRENQTVVIEDLAVKNMSRRCKPKTDPDNPGQYLHNGQKAKSGLNKSIRDASWRQLRTMLEYKAECTDANSRSSTNGIPAAKSATRAAKTPAGRHWTSEHGNAHTAIPCKTAT